MKRLLIVCLFASILCTPLYAVQDSADIRLESFVKNIQIFNHLYQQEKVYLHFDNTGYFLGENIWFKAYVTTASHLTATPMSRVLYVELLDLEGNVLNTQKLLITDGQADGTIPLTRLAMKSGFYEVRAYTRLMLNWDTETLFSRVFPVFEKPEMKGDFDKKTIRLRTTSYKIPVKRAKAPSTKKLNVDFFPEGGQLINGLTSTVAFKVTDKEGQSQEAVGCICNAQGDTVSQFSTAHEGMGAFIYTPDGDKYKVWIRSTDEKKGTNFTLPTVESSGCVMRVQNLHPEQVRIQITATPEYASVPMGLTIMCRGALSFFDALPSITKGEYSIAIHKSRLSPGVNQLTLFTPEGRILSERLVYVAGYTPALKMEVLQDKDSYKPFEQVKLEVSVQDEGSSPIETTLSLAVQDRQMAVPSFYQENIFTNMLLSSDLKGYISNPGYYFESDDRRHLQALDLLMLTQGFRRYSWQHMAGVAYFQGEHKIEKGILIDGAVKTIVRKKSQENIDVKMTMFTDSSYQQAYCPTDTAGNFNYQAPDLYGKWDLQIETKKKTKRKEYWITMDRLFSPQGRAYSFHDTYIPQLRASNDKSRFLLHPQRDNADAERFLNDSLDMEAFLKGTKTLNELLVKGVKPRNEFINKGLNIVYDVPEEENKLEDKADGYNEEVGYFLERINPFFHEGRYKGRAVFYHIDAEVRKGSMASRQEFGLMQASGKNREEIAGEQGFSGEYGPRNSIYGRITSADLESIAIIEDRSVCIALDPDLASQPTPFVLVVLKLNPIRAKAREPIGVRMTSLQGFSVPREFYSPNYNEYQLPKGDDFRRTLYWNPNVKTDVRGKASVSFFNNATCREMNVSAETMTQNGAFGSYHNGE